ncbi:MAG: NAD-dependent epimerase/dehydratase family protein [Acidobacteria bacterium]|nr:NAD-dependent epimerase/dehydratase family protein [Acidobacteriota bacterium]
MTTSRRDFVQLSVLAGGAVGLGQARAAAADNQKTAPAAKSLKILVLGGTGLIGPPMVRYAIDRGHTITLFNRGKTNSHLFPELEKLRGDRNDDLGSIEAEVAKGRTWDVVIDNTASIPRWVEESAGLLKSSTNLYLYTSSISAYGSITEPGTDEDTPVATIAPEEVPKVKTTKDITGENYGPLKALCEKAAREAFPDHAIVVRPGLIVGPGDYSDRFTYWPVRIHRGGEVMAPGNPTDPVQFIDCRDLGEWYIRLVETGAIGTYNGTGPASPMSIAGMLYGIRATTATEIEFTWVDAGFLEEHEVQAWAHMTVWVPPESEDGGLAQVKIDRAKDAGLTFRPLDETVRDTLEYWHSLPVERRTKPRAGCPPELETKTLAAWHAKEN